MAAGMARAIEFATRQRRLLQGIQLHAFGLHVCAERAAQTFPEASKLSQRCNGEQHWSGVR
eukprot:5362018-Alexandrium_andersonii.AAC.1